MTFLLCMGLALGLMLNIFLCHGTKTVFCKIFRKKKRQKTLSRGQNNVFCCCSDFVLCVWPALRMMLMNFHCYETRLSIWQGFLQKKRHLTIFRDKKLYKNTLTPKPQKQF
jgi:hypothetical protein